MNTIFAKKSDDADKIKTDAQIETKNISKKSLAMGVSDDEKNAPTNSNENVEECLKLSIQDIIKVIPTGTVDKPNSDLIDTHTEWRWRFYDINGRKLIEMSCKYPNKPRSFMNNKGEWSDDTNESELTLFNKFVTKTSYYYVSHSC